MSLIRKDLKDLSFNFISVRSKISKDFNFKIMPLTGYESDFNFKCKNISGGI